MQPYWGVVYAPPTPTPTPTPVPAGLSDYGIELQEDGQVWSASEKLALLVGVERVADAFTRFGVLGSTPPLRFDCSTVGGRIMGVTSGGTWLRGQRGWGSAIPLGDDQQSISQFQQNPTNSDVEATADMFLNWVYRRTSDSAPTDLIPNFDPNGDVGTQLNQLSPACNYPATGAWQGFHNITKTNSPDDTLPGNRRYWWMEGTLINIFANPQNNWR